jgi:hypothetical protein
MNLIASNQQEQAGRKQGQGGFAIVALALRTAVVAGSQLTAKKESLQLRLSRHPLGRILLHLATMLCHGHCRWHWAGIQRELRSPL